MLTPRRAPPPNRPRPAASRPAARRSPPRRTSSTSPRPPGRGRYTRWRPLGDATPRYDLVGGAWGRTEKLLDRHSHLPAGEFTYNALGTIDTYDPVADHRYKLGSLEQRAAIFGGVVGTVAAAVGVKSLFRARNRRRRPSTTSTWARTTPSLGLNSYGSPDKQIEAARRVLDVKVSRYE